MVQIGHFSHRPLDKGQTQTKGLVWGQSHLWSPRNNRFHLGQAVKFRGTLPLRGPARVLSWYKLVNFIFRPWDNGQTQNYSLVWGQSDFWFQRNQHLKICGANMPPPSGRIRVKFVHCHSFWVPRRPCFTRWRWEPTINEVKDKKVGLISFEPHSKLVWDWEKTE